MENRILNVAGGKQAPLDLEMPYFAVNVDKMYYTHTEPDIVETMWAEWTRLEKVEGNQIYNISTDVFQFLERTIMLFDRVCVYRFLEHISFTQVSYFIYLLSTVTEKDDEVDVIVPNYEILATMLLEEDVKSPDFESHNIELTTELLNEPSCPHASIWTVERAKHFFELEGRFEIIDYVSHYDFDGRNIYLRFWAKRL